MNIKSSEAPDGQELQDLRASNDQLRRTILLQCVSFSPGTLVLRPAARRHIIQRLRTFDDFDDADIDERHDLGDFEIDVAPQGSAPTCETIFFRVEADRVRVMLAREWWFTSKPGASKAIADEAAPPASVTIQQLNDQFRRTFKGGLVVLTAGIEALEEAHRLRLLIEVQEFDTFDDANDPWGEHDFGAFECDGLRIMFKIDYLDQTDTKHSDNPANPDITTRVLTIMRADEY